MFCGVLRSAQAGKNGVNIFPLRRQQIKLFSTYCMDFESKPICTCRSKIQTLTKKKCRTQQELKSCLPRRSYCPRMTLRYQQGPPKRELGFCSWPRKCDISLLPTTLPPEIQGSVFQQHLDIKYTIPKIIQTKERHIQKSKFHRRKYICSFPNIMYVLFKII